MRTNKRVGALLIRDKKVLLIHRFKNDAEYWVLPGGGVEDEETSEEALIRELKEETSLDPIDFHLLGEHTRTDGSLHIFFRVNTIGEPILGGPEKEYMNDKDIYILEWVDIKVAQGMTNLFPVEIKTYF